MSYKFKSLSDTEIINKPAESANVLIEDNGTIKRVPKSAIGSDNGGNSSDNNYDYDIVIHHYYSFIDNIYNPTLLYGDYNNLLNIIESNKIPKICILKNEYNDEINNHSITFYPIISVFHYNNDTKIGFRYGAESDTFYAYLNADNTMSGYKYQPPS